MNEAATLSAQALQQRVSNLIERKRYDHASAILAQALAQYPDDADLLYESALLDYMQERNGAAKTTLQSLLTREPTHFQARYLLFGVLQDEGELAQAELLLLDLIQDYPEAAVLYARYAMLMFRTQHLKKGHALAREALRLDPNDDLALMACMMGDMITGQQHAEQANLAQLMSRHPESISTAHMLISHLVQRGQYGAAKRIAIQLLQTQPDSKAILTMVVELDCLSHWSMLPLWPLNRWGWLASGVLYILTLVLLNWLRQTSPQSVATVGSLMLGYVAYSWLYPPILKRWLSHGAGI